MISLAKPSGFIATATAFFLARGVEIPVPAFFDSRLVFFTPSNLKINGSEIPAAIRLEEN